MLRARRLATALAIATILGTTGSEPSTIADNSAASILLKLDAVARAYLTTALRIECAEAIEWTDHRVMSRGELISKYIFVRDGKVTEDYRTSPDARAGAAPKEVLPGDRGVPRFLRSAFHWPQIFNRSRWSRHKYESAGMGTALGKPAIGIRFEPIPPITRGINEWSGVAWIDPDTNLILAVEAYNGAQWKLHNTVEDLRGAHDVQARDLPKAVEVERFDTEFGYERSGLRFPSRVTFHDTEFTFSIKHGQPRVHERKLLEVEQRYDQYRFFQADSEPVGTAASSLP
jgi:hypothetical protein